jgi:hypothetical protein
MGYTTDRYFGYKMPLDIIIKSNIKDEEEMRPYWAAYLNMARMNMFDTVKFISKSIGLNGKTKDRQGNWREDDEQNIPGMEIFSTSLLPEQELAAQKLLLHHFPFLKYVDVNHKDAKASGEYVVSFSRIRDILKNIGYTLNFYRNFYSHSIYIENRKQHIVRIGRINEENTGKFLQQVFTVSARLVKERYLSGNNSAQKGMLDEDSLRFITEGKVKFSKDTKGKRIAITNESYFLNPLLLDSSASIDDSRGGVINPKKLSVVGKLAIISLLLEKKYTQELLTQSGFLKGFSNTSVAPKLSDSRILFELFSIQRIRLPKKVLTIQKNKIELALDILNELKKCPSELYELLGDEDKARFSVISEMGDEILLRRSGDRFCHLVMSYFDKTKSFERIRFQYNAGKFRFLFKETKKCVDGSERMRVLQEPLNGFGRLDEIEDLRKNRLSSPWKDFDILGYEDSPRNDASILPYINDSATRYLIDGNNIGLRFGDYIPKITSNERYRVENTLADCILSKYELPAMLFYHILADGTTTDSAEKIITRYVDNYRKLFSDIKNGILLPDTSDVYTDEDFDKKIADLRSKLQHNYQVNYEDIPAKLVEYLLYAEPNGGKEGFKRYKMELIQNHLIDTQRRIRRLQEAKAAITSGTNKAGKRNFIQIKPGVLAGFLAQDIVSFQEAKGTAKLTSLNYAVMQGVMATLGGLENAEAAIKSSYIEAGLIDKDGNRGNHPFLFKVFSKTPIKDTVDLYNRYLHAKERYLEGNIPDNASFLHGDKTKWAERDDQYYRDLAGRYLNTPIVLPRQLFEPYIFNILSELSGENSDILKNIISKAKEGGRCNTTFMIRKYFEDYLNNRPQDFYGEYDSPITHEFGFRFYSVVRKNLVAAKEIIKDNKSRNQSVFLTDLQKAILWAEAHPQKQTPVRSNSKVEISEEDARRLIKAAHKDFTETSKLLRRYLVQDELLYMTAISIISEHLNLPNLSGYLLSDISPDKDGVLSNRVSTKTIVSYNGGSSTVIQNDRKMKDYGEIYKILHDKRIESILPYHNNQEIDLEDIKKEFDYYDHERVGVFKSLLDYEKKILAGLSAHDLEEIEKLDFNVVLQHDDLNNSSSQIALRHIRNGFAHNEYPSKEHDNVRLHDAQIPGTAQQIATRVLEISEATPCKKI